MEILSENTSSVTDVPIKTPRLMSSVNMNNDFNSMLYLNQTIRVLQSKENDNKLYFNISNRGYVYLDRKENAKEFSVSKLPPTNNLYYDTFRVTDLSISQSLEIYNDYITIDKANGGYKGRHKLYSANTKDSQRRLIYKNVVKDLKNEVAISKIAKDYNIARQTVYRIKKDSIVNNE